MSGTFFHFGPVDAPPSSLHEAVAERVFDKNAALERTAGDIEDQFRPSSHAGRSRACSGGGWNRIHIQVEDLAAEVKCLRDEGIRFCNDIITGPGGSEIVLDDPSGNPVELFQPKKQS